MTTIEADVEIKIISCIQQLKEGGHGRNCDIALQALEAARHWLKESPKTYSPMPKRAA